MSRQTDRQREAKKRKEEMRKAARARRAAASSNVSSIPPLPPSRSSEAHPSGWWFPKLGFGDLLALIALPLAVAGILIDNIGGVAACLAIATIIPCAAIIRHNETKIWHRAVSCLLVTSISSIIFLILYYEHDKRELTKSEGVLYSAELPRPANRCAIPDSDFAVLAGGGASFGPSQYTNILNIAGYNIISARQDANGRLTLNTLRIFDDQDNIIARIEENGDFWLHQSARRIRPDWSTIIIYDRHDNEALNLRLINKKTISIGGIFRVKGHSPVIISASSIKINGNTFVSPCFRSG